MRPLATFVAAAVLAAGIVFVGLPVRAAAQAPKRPAPAAKRPAAPRAADGHPDLQGVWDFAQLTPFERPGELDGKTALSDDEASEFAQKRVEDSNKDRRDGPATADVERAYNDFWWDFGTRVTKQVSLITDPADGRLPPLTAQAQSRAAGRRPRYDNPEERPLAERCILGFNSGPPMVPSAYNNNVQIVQTKDHVLVFNEMVHSARIVDLSGRPHPPSAVRYLTGDSIGRWEGDTLVVDTTNYAKEGVFRNSSTNLHLVERFSRPDGATLHYEFTVTDPDVWTRPFTASIFMVHSDEMMYEYACHEANYGLEGVLKGARFQDQQAK